MKVRPMTALATIVFLGCSIPPQPSPEPLCGKKPMVFSRIDPGEQMELRSGAGEVILGDFTSPLSSGQTVQVTFEFEGARRRHRLRRFGGRVTVPLDGQHT
jgi:hypothetical protein